MGDFCSLRASLAVALQMGGCLPVEPTGCGYPDLQTLSHAVCAACEAKKTAIMPLTPHNI